MAKTVTINVPITRKRGKVTTEQREGTVAYLAIGNRKEKFLLQRCPHTGKVDTLTHYATGYRFAGLVYYSITPRAAAERTVAAAIQRFGVEHIHTVIASKPVINA